MDLLTINSETIITAENQVVNIVSAASQGPAGGSSPAIIPANTYTILETDMGNVLLHPISDNSPRTYTLPNTFMVGFSFSVINLSNTITISTNNEIIIPTNTINSNTRSNFIKIDSNTWFMH